MTNYITLLKEYVKLSSNKNNIREDRTGTGIISQFNKQLEFNLLNWFPIVTTKYIHFKSIVYELLWFISGNTNIQYLLDNGITIWNEWADENGDLGPVYGAQWRKWKNHEGKEIDQLDILINGLKNSPNSRRHILNAWNVGQLNEMALPPCHLLTQWYVKDNLLSCMLYQRSADLFLGLPFNISSYALLTYMIAQVTNYIPYKLYITIGDCHLYANHIEQAKEQISRLPLRPPKLVLNTNIDNIDNFKYEDIRLINYKYHPRIKAPIAI